jgi:hypothetical protein
VTAAPAVQREAISRPFIAVAAAVLIAATIGAVGRGSVASLLLRRRLLRPLAAGDERGQPLDILVITGLRLEMLRSRLEVLRLLLVRLLLVRLLLLRLILLLSRKKRLLLARSEWFASHHRLVAVTVAIVEGVIAHAAAPVVGLLVLIVGLRLPQVFLRRYDQAEIMLRMLVVVLGCDRIAGALRITGELKVFFGNVRCGAPDFYIGPVRLVHARQRILVVTTLAVATPHALVLTVSHGCLFRSPLHERLRRCCRLNSLFAFNIPLSGRIAHDQIAVVVVIRLFLKAENLCLTLTFARGRHPLPEATPYLKLSLS